MMEGMLAANSTSGLVPVLFAICRCCFNDDGNWLRFIGRTGGRHRQHEFSYPLTERA